MTKKKIKPVLVKSKFKNLYIKPKSILERITTLHGAPQLADKKGRNSILWAFLIICNFVITICFLFTIKARFNSDQIVTKIYSDWSVEKVPFPAVTICNFNIVSLKESKTIEKLLQDHNVTQNEIESFFHDLTYLVNWSPASLHVTDHSRVMEILNNHYYNMKIVMEEVHQKCENLLVYCEFNRKQKDCKQLFKLVPTYVGFCCTFNFAGIKDEEDDPLLSQDEDLEYYYDQGEDEGERTLTNMIATTQSGTNSGLRVVFNVEPEDYARWASAPAYGAKVMLSDPNDFIETRVVYRYMDLGESLDLKVVPMIYQSVDDLRNVAVEKRGCWFNNEVSLVNTNRYSYETCTTECKIRSYRNYCGCVPFKYPVDRETRICGFSDLSCLLHMKAHWDTTSNPCIPECYVECRDKSYSVITDSVPFLTEYYPASITMDHNVSELAALHVYYMKSTCNCFMMTLLTDVNTFIATYGGIFSLSFGASLITTVELVYLLIATFTNRCWGVPL